MKNISILKLSIFIVLMLSMTYSSCSRKYGCYYTLSTPTKIEKIENASEACSQALHITNPNETSGINACNP